MFTGITGRAAGSSEMWFVWAKKPAQCHQPAHSYGVLGWYRNPSTLLDLRALDGNTVPERQGQCPPGLDTVLGTLNAKLSNS